MKRHVKLLLIPIFLFMLSGCDSSLNRTERTIDLIQENITKIINELNEIQLLESHVQEDFETTLHTSDDLSAFMDNDAVIYQNLDQRMTHLDNLAELKQALETYLEELSIQEDKLDENLLQQINSLKDNLTPLSDNLLIYIDDYKASINPERQTYQSIANPENNYTTFFKVFDNVNILYKTNQINLDNILGYFESINAKLIDLKVFITNLKG